MAFDHVVPGGGDEAAAGDAVERTVRWLERCAGRQRDLADGRQALWPILQGGTHLGLREEGLRRIGDLASWTGLAIGGLSVGEPKPVMYQMLEGLEPPLPPAWPRYLMGVGVPEDLVAAVERGMDLFDCVAPTRNGRNGSGFTPHGPATIRNPRGPEDPRPLDLQVGLQTLRTILAGDPTDL